jgi:hypothetical protein
MTNSAPPLMALMLSPVKLTAAKLLPITTGK